MWTIECVGVCCFPLRDGYPGDDHLPLQPGAEQAHALFVWTHPKSRDSVDSVIKIVLLVNDGHDVKHEPVESGPSLKLDHQLARRGDHATNSERLPKRSGLTGPEAEHVHLAEYG